MKKIDVTFDERPTLNVDLSPAKPLDVALSSAKPLNVNLRSGHVIYVADYEQLQNLPQINGVTLLGNLVLQDIFPDGVIIDGTDATVRPEEVGN